MPTNCYIKPKLDESPCINCTRGAQLIQLHRPDPTRGASLWGQNIGSRMNSSTTNCCSSQSRQSMLPPLHPRQISGSVGNPTDQMTRLCKPYLDHPCSTPLKAERQIQDFPLHSDSKKQQPHWATADTSAQKCRLGSPVASKESNEKSDKQLQEDQCHTEVEQGYWSPTQYHSWSCLQSTASITAGTKISEGDSI